MTDCLAPNPINFTKEVIKDGDREIIVTYEDGVVDMKVKMDDAIYSWDGDKFVKEQGGIEKVISKIGDMVMKSNKKEVPVVHQEENPWWNMSQKPDLRVAGILLLCLLFSLAFWVWIARMIWGE